MGFEVVVKFQQVKIVADTCLPVKIYNQAVVEIASVPAGGTYHVIQFDGICDDPDLNDSTITDNSF